MDDICLIVPFRSNKGSGFRHISALRQFLKDRILPPFCPLQVPSFRSRKDIFLSCGTYTFLLFGSKNNEIICIFNSSFSEYSITLHLCASPESVIYQSNFHLKTELKIELEGGKKGCNRYPCFLKML